MAEWARLKVRDVISHIASGPSPTCEERNASGAEWGLLKTTAATWGGWNEKAHKVPPPEYWGQGRLEVHKDDVVITKAGPRNRVGVVVHVPATRPGLMVSGKMVLLRPDQSQIAPRLLADVLASRPSQKFLDDRTTGMAEAQTNFANSTLLNTPLLLPPLKEQRRIAEILDTIDETIQATERVIAKLWDARAGLLRERLGEIDLRYASAPLLSLVSLPKGQVDPKVEPFRSMTLVAPDHIVGDGRGRLLARESAHAQGAISGKYRFGPGDVVYSKIRPELRKAWLAEGDGLCSADMYPLTPSESLESGYLAQVILGDRFSRFAASVSGRSSGMPKVNREELSEFKIAVPPTPVQAEVGQLALNSMARIDAETALLEKLVETRSGLAADLLSGRVRTVAA